MPTLPSLRGSLRAASALVAALALVVALPHGAAAAPGDLDPAFGTGGKTVINRGFWEEGQDVALQADGRIVTVGSNLQAEYLTSEFSVMRHNADGSLDTSFGDGGETITDFAGGEDRAHAVALQPVAGQVKIVVAGEAAASEGGCCVFTVARYNADGSLDTGFGTGGRVPTDLSGVARAVAVQPDGKIVAAGQSVAGPGDVRFAVARYNPDGTPDSTFGTDGRVLTPFEGGGSGNDLALQPDGRIVVVGNRGALNGPTDFALARYNTNGTLDSTFGTGGKVTTVFSAAPGFAGDDSAGGVAVQSDGKIVAAGYTGYDFALARYTAGGALDPAYGTGGRVITDFNNTVDRAYDLALQPDGRAVAVGLSAADFGVARYNVDGSLDSGFGTGGKTSNDMGFGYFDEANAVALQPDGKIVAFGNAGDDRALARYVVDSTPSGVDLSVTKTGTGTVSIGDRATYTIRVTNNSTTTAATGVALTDTFSGLIRTVISATPSQGTCTTAVTCALGTLAPRATATVTVVVEPRSTGTLTDRATASATQTDPVAGNDTATTTTIVNNSRGCTRIGSSGNDTITGTSGNDVICGLGGDDTINAGSGYDTVYGGYGNDRIDGGFHNDNLYGGSGNDNLIGNYGNDRLNTVDNVSGNDTANGSSGADACTTDTGDIRISCS